MHCLTKIDKMCDDVRTLVSYGEKMHSIQCAMLSCYPLIIIIMMRRRRRRIMIYLIMMSSTAHYEFAIAFCLQLQEEMHNNDNLPKPKFI